MTFDTERMARQLRLDWLQKMRLEELAEVYPRELTTMVADGSLGEYLRSWRQSAEEYHRSLMDKWNPAGAWWAAGATPQLEVEDPVEWHQRANMVRHLAEDMLIQEMVLQPLVTPEG
jgi:hypothetical protein